MLNAEDRIIAVPRQACVMFARRWKGLGSDWQSVVIGLAVVGAVVGLDVPIPG